MDSDTAGDVSVRQSVYTGILPFQAIREMVDGGEIRATEILGAIEADQIQPASIDLRLGQLRLSRRYQLPSGPRREGAGEDGSSSMPDFERFKIDLSDGAVLEKGRVYVVPLAESSA